MDLATGVASVVGAVDADHLVEAVHFVRGADAQRGPLVDGVDLHVEHRAARHAVGRLAAGLLDEQAKGSRLEGEAQLRRRLVRRRVREDALALGELCTRRSGGQAGQ